MKSIFKTFFKVGAILLGGGYVILPLLTSELVDKRKWITSDELCEFYAISTSLPGIIAVNTALFTGRKLLGRLGAIVAVIAMVLPAFITIISIASILSIIASSGHVKNVFWGIDIGVIVLLFLAVKEMWKKSIVDKYSMILYVISLIMLLFFKVSPVYIVIFSIVTGIAYQFFMSKKGSVEP